jgi:hypothetical protein
MGYLRSHIQASHARIGQDQWLRQLGTGGFKPRDDFRAASLRPIISAWFREMKFSHLRFISVKFSPSEPSWQDFTRSIFLLRNRFVDVVTFGIILVRFCDAPGFYSPLIVGQICWQWSNHGQPGSSPRKPHQPTLMTPLIKLTHMCGQALVKSTVKPYLNPSDLECPPEILLRSPNFT